MNKSKGIFWLMITGIHLFFFFYQQYYQSGHFKDSEEYIQSAQNLIQQGSFYCGDFDEPIRMDNYTKRPPVYPSIITVFGSGTGLMLLQTLLSLLNIYLVVRICKQLYPSVNAYLILFPVLLFYPAQFIYANAVMTEMLFQSLLLGMLILLDTNFLTAKAQWEERKGRKAFVNKTHFFAPFAVCFAPLRLNKNIPIIYFLIYTLILLLAIWTKPIMYLFVFVHLIGSGIWAWRKRKFFILVLALLPLLCVGLYMGWNKQRTGYFHFSSIQNLSLLQYSTTYLLISKYGEEEGYKKADEILYRSLDKETYELEQKSLQRDCMDTISSNPFRYAVLHLKGMVNFFMDPGRYDLYAFFNATDKGGEGMLKAFSEDGYSGIWRYLLRQPLGWLFLLGIIFLFNLAKLAGLIAFAINRDISRQVRWIILIFILYIAILTGISGASRFAVPVFPLMLLALPSLMRFIPKAISSKMKLC